ncbi:MAG: hypothetical protein U9P00_11185 [Pseudomonadota bacterium]|nr:hypothetical protein [Pseudomonadota bacterium]
MNLVQQVILSTETTQRFSVNTGIKNPLLGFLLRGARLDCDFILLLLLRLLMVARDRIEPPTRGFSGPVKSITY